MQVGGAHQPEKNPPLIPESQSSSGIDQKVNEIATKALSQTSSLVSGERIFEIFKTAELCTFDETHLMGEFYPAKAPDHSSPPNRENCDKWVRAHPEEFQVVAQKLIDNIQHITHKEFLYNLEICVEKFNNYLDRKEDKSYVIVISGNYDRSPLWVTSLAADFLKYPPTKIIMDYDPNYEDFIGNTKIQNIVTFDDAAYSGSQMSEFLEENILPYSQDKTIHTIIPFMTKIAKKNISSLLKESKAYISTNQIMPSFAEMLTPEEQELLITKGAFQFQSNKKNEEDNPSGFGQLTPIYFDHKVSDSLSTIEGLRYGTSLNGSSEPKIQFIPEIIPPYKAENTDTP